MQSKDSPFPCFWWGIGLESIGLENVRACDGTYGRYGFEQLPRLPFDMRGEFDWLDSEPVYQGSISEERKTENIASFIELRKNIEHVRLKLPAAFIKFFETPALQQRIRSNTDCYLDLCSEPISSPISDGYLIRFLSDSQGCIFWYLYLTKDGLDHAVVSSERFFGTKAEMWRDDEPPPEEIVFCAESLELFLCRFWLENKIWFSDHENEPMPDVGRKYIEAYRSE